ncbi:MAG: hypothetical protein LBK94_07560 [Prevotellaceae bacterium]|nr:hypothetical protein [Prevotellaceae bacterium]
MLVEETSSIRQASCRDVMLVESDRACMSRGELPRHSDESRNPPNDGIAGHARNDEVF